MYVKRDNKFIFWNSRPYAEIYITVPYHPSQEYVHTLACAAARRRGKKLQQPFPFQIISIYCSRIHAQKNIDNPGQPCFYRRIALSVVSFKGRLEAAILLDNSA